MELRDKLGRVSLLFTVLLCLVVAVIWTGIGTYSPLPKYPFPEYASGATKPVSGLDADTNPAEDDLLMSVDVSDTTMSAQGTSKKVQLQHVPRGFAAQTISGNTIANNVRMEQIDFTIDTRATGTTKTGVSTFKVAHFGGDVIGYSLCTMQLDGPSIYFVAGAAGGVTVQVYYKNKEFHDIGTGVSTMFLGSGVSTSASGGTCFETFASGTTDIDENDVLIAYVSGVSPGVTDYITTLTLKIKKDG